MKRGAARVDRPVPDVLQRPLQHGQGRDHDDARAGARRRRRPRPQPGDRRHRRGEGPGLGHLRGHAPRTDRGRPGCPGRGDRNASNEPGRTRTPRRRRGARWWCAGSPRSAARARWSPSAWARRSSTPSTCSATRQSPCPAPRRWRCCSIESPTRRRSWTCPPATLVLARGRTGALDARLAVETSVTVGDETITRRPPRMTIVYDLQGTQSIHHGERGIARYVLELALGLDRVAPGLVDLFAYNPDLPVPASLDPFRASGRLVPCDDDRVSTCRLFHMASPMENGIPGHRLLPPAVRRRAAVVATVYGPDPAHLRRALPRRSAEPGGVRPGLARCRPPTSWSPSPTPPRRTPRGSSASGRIASPPSAPAPASASAARARATPIASGSGCRRTSRAAPRLRARADRHRLPQERRRHDRVVRAPAAGAARPSPARDRLPGRRRGEASDHRAGRAARRRRRRPPHRLRQRRPARGALPAEPRGGVPVPLRGVRPTAPGGAPVRRTGRLRRQLVAARGDRRPAGPLRCRRTERHRPGAGAGPHRRGLPTRPSSTRRCPMRPGTAPPS